MSKLVLFHSGLGLRPGIEDLAGALRTAGHEVWTPDLFEGRVFDDLDAGIAERDRLGVPTLVDRAGAAVAQLPSELVYVGLSMGTAPAQLLACTRPGALGAVLIQGALPLEAIGRSTWPERLLLQLHTSPDDPFHDEGAVGALRAQVPPRLLDEQTYPGCDHLFVDPGLPVHDESATQRLLTSVLGWLSSRVEEVG